ncbi:hypothetical protein EK21DRAFT_97414 [Setomelanomma holmii]|uniref:DUF8021 domain-containing protein n=1 Tax=Setomelanomma holmii TaxID=210430 RepID=A0A9P4LSH9_9PLEO|nr:hypothetical protein EK21DRAFT_97414 [Setomelanomma holmii]
MRYVTTTIVAIFATQVIAACTRETLKSATGALLTAQTAGQTSFAANATYTENRKKVDIKSSILSKALKIDHVRAQHDVSQCAAFSEFIVTNSAAPYVIASQLRLDNTTNAVAKIDSIDPIPAEKRDSRAAIQAAGDTYCDTFNDKSVKVPWGGPCARLEGGSYTDKGQANDTCDVGIPSGVTVVNRQYVIDDEYGTVDIIMDFGGTQGNVGAAGLPNSHEFRLEGGKIRGRLRELNMNVSGN